jgi:hypothetical protein
MVPEAFFDCLQIASKLGDPMNGVSRMDLQRIAFLSCLLSIYQAKPVSDWGYRFANTGCGTPYSDQLNDAVVRLTGDARLQEVNDRFQITASGKALLNVLTGHTSIIGRSACVDAACASMLAVPLSTMAIGLDQEPTVAASHLRTGATLLLEEPYLHLLHKHFQVLAKVLSPSATDLFSPSVLWLSYMSETKLSERTETFAAEDHQ